MNRITYRTRLLSSALLALGLTVTASPALADSVCAIGPATILTNPLTFGVDCTSINGNGHTEEGGATAIGVTFVSPAAVVDYFASPTNVVTTGYIESTTAGKGVIRVTTDQALTYVGTGSTLVGQAGATGATTLDITAPDVTLFTGNLTANGAGSTALSVTANGGAGSGGINATVDGDILSAGPGIVLTQTNAAATGNVVVTSTAGNDITAGTGTGLAITTAGSGGVNVNLAGSVTTTAGEGVTVRDTATGGNISVTAGTVTAGGAGSDGVDVQSQSTGANVTVVTNGVVTAGNAGIVAAILNGSATGNISTTSNAAINARFGIDAENFGTGTTTVNAVGPIAATSGNGIFARTAGGNVVVTAGAVSSTGDTAVVARQTNAAGTGTISVTTTGAVSGTNGIEATNSGLGGVTVGTTGLVTGTAGSAINASNTNAASTGNILVTAGAGGATATADAITASTAGTGTVTVNSSGPVTSSGGNGITTNATTGATAINVTGGSVTGTNGIVATGTSGATGVTLTGGADVTGTAGDGITLTSTGAKTLTVGAGSVVSGTTQAVFYSGSGTMLLNNSGTIGTLGGIAIFAQGGTTNATINNLAGGILNGRVDLNAGNETINNAGTWNASGAQNFYAGTNVINNQTGGVINFATGSSLSGPVAVTNTGTINVAGTLAAGGSTLAGAGTLNLAAGSAVSGLGATTLGNTNAGAGSSLAGTGAFVNGGTLDTAGAFTTAGFTTMSNTGTIDLAPGAFTVPAVTFTNSGTIIADEGASSITGQTSFANSGTINLQDGVPDDVLTINSGFVGSGASNLLVDYSGTAVDQLVITGAASGTTAINVSPTAGVVINPTPLLVVDTGTSTANAFVLGTTSANFGLIDLALTQNGADYFLSSTPNVAAVEPVVVGNLANNLWYQSADIYSNYAALRRTDLGVARTSNLGFWGQAYYEHDKDDNQDVSVFGSDFTVGRVTNKRYGLQAGVDYLMGLNAVLGITGGYERDKADIRNSAADFKASGWNLGAYAMFGGASGFYGDLLVKYDQAKLKFGSPLFVTMTRRPDITSWGARGQLGYRFVSGSMNFDLGAGLAYVTSKIDDFSVGTIDFDFDRAKSLRGDLTARVGFGNGPFAPFIEGRLFHDFEKNRRLTLVSGTAIDTIDGEGRGTWGRIEAGIGAQNSSGPLLAAWGDFGDVKGFGLKAGWRFGGSPAEAALPPPVVAPPPPPPVAPATQTCPDGSVILATSTCPAPPPPPPPPPPVERGERGK